MVPITTRGHRFSFALLLTQCVCVQSASVQALVCSESFPSAANGKLNGAQIRNGQRMVPQHCLSL